jgi:pimeloyl-ACP methyl ester carboxylesterase
MQTIWNVKPGRAFALHKPEASMYSSEQSIAPPSKLLMLMELRALNEFGAFLGALPLLSFAPAGDGHPVIVLPGLLTGDEATRPLRRFLSWKNYDVHGWALGRNLGLRNGLFESMTELVTTVHEKRNRKVSLVGWSLGGIYARELAKLMPDHVRSVITLGSPFSGSPKSTNAWRAYELASGRSVEEASREFGEGLSQPPPVPTSAIFSRSDGICAWRGCMEKPSANAENIEVDASHCGMGAHPAVAFAVADRLAQAEGEWRPFSRSGWRSAVFPDSTRP